MEKSFEEVFKLVNYPQEDIRKAVVDALTQFCINFSKIETQEGREATLKALSLFIPKLSELIRLDTERCVVMQALDAYAELLEHLKSYIFIGPGHKEAIMNCITDVMLGNEKNQFYNNFYPVCCVCLMLVQLLFSGHTECQDQDELDGEDANEGEAEHDELLFECAGQVLTNLGNAIPPEDFALYLQIVFPILIKRLVII